MNGFQECLDQSHKASDWSGWLTLYQSFFGQQITLVDHREDGWHQRAGIDRSIILPNSKQILIDEKVRGRNKKTGRVYEDIALEYWSKVRERVKGWVAKDLACDFIAYAILPIGKCYLLPFVQLRQAWRRYHKEWVATYGHRDAENNGYMTRFCPVPADIVTTAISEISVVHFEPFDCVDD
jgi:hypothetical protein